MAVLEMSDALETKTYLELTNGRWTMICLGIRIAPLKKILTSPLKC
jgi:hypothetical protein